MQAEVAAPPPGGHVHWQEPTAASAAADAVAAVAAQQSKAPSSVFSGLSWNKANQKWRAQIGHAGKMMYVSLSHHSCLTPSADTSGTTATRRTRLERLTRRGRSGASPGATRPCSPKCSLLRLPLAAPQRPRLHRHRASRTSLPRLMRRPRHRLSTLRPTTRTWRSQQRRRPVSPRLRRRSMVA